MRARDLGSFVVLALLSAACGVKGAAASSTSSSGACTTTKLFGRPNDKTGLDATECVPSCGCGASAWTEPAWTQDKIASLLTWTLLNPPAELTSDPYASPPSPAPDGSVCAVQAVDPGARTYRLATYPSDRAATADGAIVTHWDGCGTCSTLADLAVYARELDLTTPVRQCGLDHANDFAGDVTCLEALGFTPPCAEIWAYNTNNTRNQCLSPCIASLSKPYQNPDGSLNDCLQCDEDKSGPVFKAVAGRTRRNTGIASALCRPCSEVHRIAHDYP
jgi:hypothetical protein